MLCKKCGKEAVEGAIFCGDCGGRLDGKIACISCGKLNEDVNAYCNFCGARIDGKTTCKNCGTAYESKFCPTCGQQAAATSKVCEEKQPASSESLLKKICKIVGGASVMLGVFFSMLFVFFVGLELSQSTGGALEKIDIFYFFGDAYKEIDELATGSMLDWFALRTESYHLLYCIVGTVLSSLTLLSVVSFGTVAIVKYALSWAKKTEDKSHGWAIATIVSFLAGTALFYAYNAATVGISGSSLGALAGQAAETSTSFNGGAIAGIVLSAVALGVGLIFRYVRVGGGVWKGSKLPQTVCALVGVALAGVTLTLFKNALLSAGLDLTIVQNSSRVRGTIGVSSGFLEFVTLAYALLGGLVTDRSAEYYEFVTVKLDELAIYGIVGQALLIACILFAAIALGKCLQGVCGDGKSGVVWAALGLGAAIGLLVFSTLSAGAVQDILTVLLESESGSVGDTQTYYVYGRYAAAIAAIALSTLLLAATITRAIFAKREN